ncbi:MAG: VWA domain-containing protein [Negativicutes bacterium]|nr:VWA domain-containing protein [Negativicutes bacterium]
MKQNKYAPGTNEPLSETEIGLSGTPDPRCPCFIMVDVSGSMAGKPIAEANAGLQILKTNLTEDLLACSRVEIALATFNHVAILVAPFCSPENFAPPTLVVSGGTRLGTAVIWGLGQLDAWMAELRAAGASYYRPWFIVITDAESSDRIEEAARLVKQAESEKRISFFSIGVLGANMDTLGKLSLRSPRHLEGLKFAELFEWFSVNLSAVATSQPGEQVALTQPTWTTV